MSKTKVKDIVSCCLFCNDTFISSSSSSASASLSSASKQSISSALSKFIQFHRSNQKLTSKHDNNEEESPYQSLFTNITYCQGCLVKIYHINSLFEQLNQLQDQLIHLQQEVLQQLKSSTSSSRRRIKENQAKQIILAELESSLTKSTSNPSTRCSTQQKQTQMKDPSTSYVKLIRLNDVNDNSDETLLNNNDFDIDNEIIKVTQEQIETGEIKVEDFSIEYQSSSDHSDVGVPHEHEDNNEVGEEDDNPASTSSASSSSRRRIRRHEALATSVVSSSSAITSAGASPQQSKTFNQEILTMSKFECKHCSRIYPKPRAFWAHLKSDHSQLFTNNVSPSSSVVDYTCSFCPASYSLSDSLQNHYMRKHTHEQITNNSTLLQLLEKAQAQAQEKQQQQESLFCTICTTSFTNSTSLQNHNQNLHGKSYLCSICPLVFTNLAKLKRHQVRVHATELNLPTNQNQCHVCGRCLSSPSELKRHVNVIHHRQGRFPCAFAPESCTFSAWDASRLRLHIISAHGQPKDWLCSICGASYLKRNKLEEHVRTHTGEKPFVCRFCGKRFHSRKCWRNHEPIHGDERPFSCDLCGLGFPTMNNLNGHTRSHHKGKKGIGVGVRPTRKSKYNNTNNNNNIDS